MESNLLLVALKERPRRLRQAEWRGRMCRWRQIVDDASLQLRTDVCSGRELAFCQSIYAVVFDDVDHGQIAAKQMHKLAHADGRRVAVA